eukprot:CAMPEP_0194305822 /NCGR_PEP_ID=MMETSP0171-20130528/3162_1 /TAXON_ID=218684 /ORGANISM="Corethron pennatum, Strain L29A3" /LENGTH=113 /DNA_ID=CAMNT_0039057459 /DNA_START=41 /DNA_END=382 /DNA_ORIENTATION=+
MTDRAKSASTFLQTAAPQAPLVKFIPPPMAASAAIIPVLLAPFLTTRDLVAAAPVCSSWEEACGDNKIWRKRCATELDAKRGEHAHVRGFFRKLYLSVVEELIEEDNLCGMGH